MYTKTKAVVLSAVKYGDKGRVLRCFTEEFGTQAYMLNSVSAKNAPVKPSMLLPLTQLEIEVTHRAKGKLERIKNARVWQANFQLHANEVKNAMAFFIAEVLVKTLKEEQQNTPKFNFVVQTCQALNNAEKVPAHFHIAFLLQLASFLGIAPHPAASAQANYLDFLEGTFKTQQPLHPYFVSPEIGSAIKSYMASGWQQPHPAVAKTTRMAVLNALVAYYKYHIEEFGTVKSLEILSEIFA